MFSFKNQDLHCLPVELEDGSKIHIKPPSKRLAEALENLLQNPTTDTMVRFTADVLSENIEGIKYEVADLADMPFESMALFIAEYQRFLYDGLAGKN